MGLINSTVPILLTECSPARDKGIFSRGKLVAVSLTILNCGIVLSYWTGESQLLRYHLAQTDIS